MDIYSAFTVETVATHSRRPDPYLMVSLFLLLSVGLAMLLSASYFKAQQLYGNPLEFVSRQGMWVLIGVSALALAAFVPLDVVRAFLPMVLVATILLSLLTLVPGVGARYLGGRRWIFLFGVSFQPSELVKLVLILYLAHILSRWNGDFSRPQDSLLPPFLVTLLFAGIILLQNDFSTAMFVGLIALVLFFIAGVPASYFGKLFFIIIPTVLIILFSREHRVQRIMAFIDPYYDPAGSGYQVLAARSALQRGGFWGVGIGAGTRKLGGLPEAHADFLFAVIGEELGLFGITMIVLLFAFFAARGIQLAFRQEDQFRSMLIFGLVTSIILQAMLNMAVVAGVVPATGIPLPFFSSGGSSLLITMTMCGLIINAARPVQETQWPT